MSDELSLMLLWDVVVQMSDDLLSLLVLVVESG